MISVGSYEAKTHLPSLLEKVVKGEEVTITKHGVPIAKLVSVSDGVVVDRTALIEKMRAFRKKGITTGGMSIREMREEGRK